MIALIAAGCAAEKGLIPAPLYTLPEPADGGQAASGKPAKQPQEQLTVSATPLPPTPARSSTVKPAPAEPAKAEKADISLMFDQIPLPTFIQIAFGTILKKNFSTDPAVAARTDLVTLRTGSPQTPTQVLETVKMLLKTYGIAVTELGGFYRIAPDSNLSAYAPEIRRGRAQPEVPLPLRPVFNLVELTAVRNGDISIWLKAMFGNKLTVQEDPVRNALMLSGQSGDVTAALEAIQVLDQPLMRGRGSRRITPGFLSADELARKLIDVLTAEGYAASMSVTTNSPIILVPVSASNSLLAFSVDPAILAHVIAWAKQLDAPASNAKGGGGFFTYPVKYADAQDLAKTMQDLLASATAPAAAPAPGAPAGVQPRKTGRIVVNAATNTLIFLSSQDEYSQMLGILKELDQPAKSALIEVTVAEVSINDKSQLGIEWDLNPISRANGTVTGGTLGGTGLGTGGLTLNFLNSASVVKAKLNALASTNRASILSTPRIMARNGETATIQVGAEVPIITSQQSNANTVVGGATGGILQTIQYRNTGVILKVKPVIHAGNRIELDVSQEVSEANGTTTGVNTSPTISNRKVDTKLSIRDGATVLLGGLMSSSGSNGNAGVPFLKDIPALGQLFRNNTDSNVKTELIVLITPYVIDDDLVAEQVTEAFRSQLGPWAQTAGGSPQPKIVTRKDTPPESQEPEPAKIDSPLPFAAPEPEKTPAAETPAPPPAPPAQPATPAGNRVTDPALLEELRKAAGIPPQPKAAGTPPKKN